MRAVAEHRPRLVVLDVGLPDVDGLEVCRRLRQTSTIPVIFLTARDSEVDRVLGLELGADDYVTKPFSPAELVARVKAVLRRTEGPAAAEIIQVGDGDDRPRPPRGARRATTRSRSPPRSSSCSGSSPSGPGLALSRQQILDGVWGYDWFGDARTVDVHLAQVRKKLDGAVRIDTVRGVGYRLEPRMTARPRSLHAHAGSSPRWCSSSVVVLGLSYATTYVLVRRELQENALSNLRSRTDRAAAARRSRLAAESGAATAGSAAGSAACKHRPPRRPAESPGSSAVLVGPDGTVSHVGTDAVFALPDGARRIRPRNRRSCSPGNDVSGRHGNTVFLAIPARLIGRQRLVVIATDQVETKVLSSATPLARCSPGSWCSCSRSVSRSGSPRRLTRPIREIERAAGQLASGDLSGRADVPPGTDADLADARRHAQRDGRAARAVARAASARSCSRSRTTCARRSRRSAATRRRSPTAPSTTPTPTRASAPRR